MKLVFMGTPDIAATALEALLASEHSVVGVFTREDKPVGRKQILTAPPVKQLSLIHIYTAPTKRPSSFFALT